MSSHQKTSGVAACSRPTAIPASMGARVAGREAGGAAAVWWSMAWRTLVGGAYVSATPLYRLYDVVDGAAGLGCVALVVDERLVRRAGDGAVGAVRRELGEVVLLAGPAGLGVGAGRQDGQRPVPEAGQLGR